VNTDGASVRGITSSPRRGYGHHRGRAVEPQPRRPANLLTPAGGADFPQLDDDPAAQAWWAAAFVADPVLLDAAQRVYRRAFDLGVAAGIAGRPLQLEADATYARLWRRIRQRAVAYVNALRRKGATAPWPASWVTEED
jgi:hypothetical protein